MMTERPRILILDDQADLFEGLKLLLEEEGFDVTMTTTPFSLPFVIRAENPDLVLIDVHMPALSAEGLLKSIPRSALQTTAPIVLFSGMPPDDLAAMVERTGADGCIYKGMDVKLVIKQIKLFAAQRTGEAEVR